MSPAPGIYEGKLPDSLVMGRCYLNYALATEDSTEDTDKFPDKRRRPSSEVKLYVQPTLTGPFYSQADETLYSVEPFVLTSNNGVFDFWAIDPTHSSIIPSGWVWTATLVDGSKTVGNITFSPDSTKPADQYVNLGLLAVTGSAASGSTAADLQTMLQTLLESSSTGPAGRGIRTITSSGGVATVTYTDNTTQDFALPRGESGATPELTWSGTTLLINGSNGVDLKGAKGDAGPANTLSIGTVTEGAAAATITGTSPNQTLNLTLPKVPKGDAEAAAPGGRPVISAKAGAYVLPLPFSYGQGNSVNDSWAANRAYFAPWFCSVLEGTDIVIKSVTTHIVAAGSADAIFRWAVYTSGSDGRPSTKLGEVAFAAAATGIVTVNTNITIPNNSLVWFAHVAQGTTLAQARNFNHSSMSGFSRRTVADAGLFGAEDGNGSLFLNGVTGALPATATGLNNASESGTIGVAWTF